MKKYPLLIIILIISLHTLIAQTISKEETDFFDALILAKTNTNSYKIKLDNFTLSKSLKDSSILSDNKLLINKIELLKTNDSIRDFFYGMLNYYYSGAESILTLHLEVYDISKKPVLLVTSENTISTIVTNIKNAKYNYESEYLKSVDTTSASDTVYKDTLNLTTAKFIGGESAMFKYINRIINYPEYEREADISGRVLIQFIIEKDGGISNVKCLKRVSRGIDIEAMRVIKLMPKWIPATYKNKPVRMWFNMPINFTLQ